MLHTQWYFGVTRRTDRTLLTLAALQPNRLFLTVWFFLAVFATTENASLRLILDESLFLSLHVSSTHHCFCAIDLCVLSCLLWCRRRLDLRSSRTLRQNIEHVCARAMTNKQQRNAFDCTHTTVDPLLIDGLEREPKRTSLTHTHARIWSGEEREVSNTIHTTAFDSVIRGKRGNKYSIMLRPFDLVENGLSE